MNGRQDTPSICFMDLAKTIDMKKTRKLILVLSTFSLIGCMQGSIDSFTREGSDSEDSIRLNSEPLNEFQLTGAEAISDKLSVSCIGSDGLPANPKSWSELILGYGANDSGVSFSVNNPSTENDRYRAFVSDIGKHVVSLMDSLGVQNMGYPNFIYAGIAEGAQIYADKVLFGRKAGSSLNDFFVVKPSLLFCMTYPEYMVEEYHFSEGWDYRCSFGEYHSVGRALTFGNQLSLGEIPSDEYDEVTFTIEIPIECEYMQQIIYGKDYPEEYYEQGLVERNENRVLRGSVTVRFEE